MIIKMMRIVWGGLIDEMHAHMHLHIPIPHPAHTQK